MTNIELFMDARQYIVDSIEPMINCYLTGIWDPHIKFVLVKEVYNLINRDLNKRFPDLGMELYPRVKFRIFEEELNIECGIQKYINHEKNLRFLGSTGIGGVMYDLYVRESYDPRAAFMFIARYGHEGDNYFSGSKTAEAEYYLGQATPLSVAYGMAIEDGYLD